MAFLFKPLKLFEKERKFRSYQPGMEQIRTHLSDEELDRYRSGRMSPIDLLTADDHLAACDACYERFGGDESLRAAYELARVTLSQPELEGPEYASDDNMGAYVSNDVATSEQGPDPDQPGAGRFQKVESSVPSGAVPATPQPKSRPPKNNKS